MKILKNKFFFCFLAFISLFQLSVGYVLTKKNTDVDNDLYVCSHLSLSIRVLESDFQFFRIAASHDFFGSLIHCMTQTLNDEDLEIPVGLLSQLVLTDEFFLEKFVATFAANSEVS